MFNTSGYFRGVTCPYYANGLCERPYCHFRHVKADNNEQKEHAEQDGSSKEQSQTSSNSGSSLSILNMVGNAIQQVQREIDVNQTRPPHIQGAPGTPLVYKPTLISHGRKQELASTNFSNRNRLQAKPYRYVPTAIPKNRPHLISYKPTPIKELKKQDTSNTDLEYDPACNYSTSTTKSPPKKPPNETSKSPIKGANVKSPGRALPSDAIEAKFSSESESEVEAKDEDKIKEEKDDHKTESESEKNKDHIEQHANANKEDLVSNISSGTESVEANVTKRNETDQKLMKPDEKLKDKDNLADSGTKKETGKDIPIEESKEKPKETTGKQSNAEEEDNADIIEVPIDTSKVKKEKEDDAYERTVKTNEAHPADTKNKDVKEQDNVVDKIQNIKLEKDTPLSTKAYEEADTTNKDQSIMKPEKVKQEQSDQHKDNLDDLQAESKKIKEDKAQRDSDDSLVLSDSSSDSSVGSEYSNTSSSSSSESYSSSSSDSESDTTRSSKHKKTSKTKRKNKKHRDTSHSRSRDKKSSHRSRHKSRKTKKKSRHSSRSASRSRSRRKSSTKQKRHRSSRSRSRSKSKKKSDEKHGKHKSTSSRSVSHSKSKRKSNDKQHRKATSRSPSISSSRSSSRSKKDKKEKSKKDRSHDKSSKHKPESKTSTDKRSSSEKRLKDKDKDRQKRRDSTGKEKETRHRDKKSKESSKNKHSKSKSLESRHHKTDKKEHSKSKHKDANDALKASIKRKRSTSQTLVQLFGEDTDSDLEVISSGSKAKKPSSSVEESSTKRSLIVCSPVKSKRKDPEVIVIDNDNDHKQSNHGVIKSLPLTKRKNSTDTKVATPNNKLIKDHMENIRKSIDDNDKPDAEKDRNVTPAKISKNRLTSIRKSIEDILEHEPKPGPSNENDNPKDDKTAKDLESDIDNDVDDLSSDDENDFEEVEDMDLEAMFEEDDPFDECLKIFNESKGVAPVNDQGPLKKKKTETEAASSSLAKKRKAHDKAANIPVKKSKPKTSVRMTPAQVMHNRFQDLQKKMTKVAAVNDSNTQVAYSMSSSTSSVQRTAHTPKAKPGTSLLTNKRRESLVKKTQEPLQIGTIAKNAKRVAHVPAVATVQRPTVPADFGSKIPSSIRQRYLNLIIDEQLKGLKPGTEEGPYYEKSLAVEKAVYDRSKSKNIYLNLVVCAIKQIRNDNAKSQASTSSGSKKPAASRKVSHNAVLGGAPAARTTFTVNRFGAHKQLTDADLKGSELYNRLQPYLLTEEQLRENGFPRPNPDKAGAALFYKEDKEKKTITSSEFEKVCCRCGSRFMVLSNGRYSKDEECVHHWGRAYKRKLHGVVEARYNCCQESVGARGCSVAKMHVFDDNKKKDLSGYMKTLPCSPLPDGDYGVYALDCEMVYTLKGFELARVTVVGDNLNSVFEKIVKPEKKIIDYNTRFSGLTEEDMEGVVATLRDVQAALLSLFDDKTILLGHSLESDLTALKLLHNTVVDTSVVFPHRLGAPYKRALRNLMAEYRQKIIQNDVGGHDSMEDATSCMELMFWKIKEDAKKELIKHK
ncbi:unnamed protein product [Owenia fusiformis]|uniref:Uncharacterized protein n=1 Tax=Owenia fusiformis TaxID=6347 RepID=A0A8J1U8W4_OWEFU|nr:unnamed protein product [Owenia fusiformis]